ncbi:MAG: sigma-54 interaction domain-containing protein [Vicinamibacterales bacterium]
MHGALAEGRSIDRDVDGTPDLRPLQAHAGRGPDLIGRSRPIRRLCRVIARLAPTDASVLVTGESGSGKDVVARSIHELSTERPGAFLPVNCAAISPHLMESELFGHERGSFTGADRRHRGCFERASGGTLFLDEVTEMPPGLQAKLLRVLETGTFTRVGGEAPVSVDVRIIASTNRPVRDALHGGALRADLYYRLRVFELRVPPLRERQEDIEPLARHFLAEVSPDRARAITPAALDRLRSYRWPGNVRELRNAVQSAAVLADDAIDVDALPEEVCAGGDGPAARATGPDGAEVVSIPVGTSLRDAEHRVIAATLRRQQGNKVEAAAILGISLKTLYNRLHRYELQS